MTSQTRESFYRAKIMDLFDYRQLPYLMKLGQVKDVDSLMEKLIELQMAIYELDLYLEENWEIRKTDLNKFWKAIHEKMILCGIKKSKVEDYSLDILQYQKHELDLRKKKTPLDKPMDYFYHYKSCDVRLIRQIIYKQCPRLNKTFAVDDWKYFDLITEVNDDVSDLEEDTFTINGNSFLISIAKDGKTKTRKRFLKFITEIEEANIKGATNSKSSCYGFIQNLTQDQIFLTKNLIEEMYNRVKTKEIKDARLIRLWRK